MASIFFRNYLPNSQNLKKESVFKKIIEKSKIRYKRSLKVVLNKPFVILGVVGVLFILSLFLGRSSLGYELFPKTDVGQMEILIRKESGTPLRTTEKAIEKMEEIIREIMGDDLSQIVSNIGVFYDLPAAYTPNSGVQDAFIKVQLTEDRENSTDSYVPILRQRFKGEYIEVSSSTEHTEDLEYLRTIILEFNGIDNITEKNDTTLMVIMTPGRECDTLKQFLVEMSLLYDNITISSCISEFPGVEFSFNTGGLITAALNEGKSSPIDVQVKGNDLMILRQLSERLRDTINNISATRDVRILQRIDQPTKEVDIDRVKAAELGVDPVDAIKNLVSALNSSTTFNKAFWIDENNGNHYYVGVTYPESEINKQHTLENVISTSKYGNAVPYKQFSRIKETTQPVEINHHNLTREFNVYANIEGSDIGTVSDEIDQRIVKFRKTLPKGYEVNFEGEVSVMKNSFSNLFLGLILAIIFAFLIITPLFKSFKQPLIIIFAFPLGIIGVVFLMLLTNTYLSIQSIMGIIMMVGISVSYGNILIDRVNNLIKEGLSFKDAIINGCSDRFRPVLMTATTTVFAMMPTAIGLGGSETNTPLAIAVIGGTTTATILTLYIIPTLYLIIVKSKTDEK